MKKAAAKTAAKPDKAKVVKTVKTAKHSHKPLAVEEPIPAPSSGKYLVSDAGHEWVGERIGDTTFRKYVRANGVQRTEDVEIGPDAVVTEITKQEFYEKAA